MTSPSTRRATTIGGMTTTIMPSTEDLTGKQLGSYRLIQRLAQGGAGTVYRTQSMRTKLSLAVKVLHEEKLGVKKDVAGFTQEYEIGKSLKHPGILNYLDFGNYEGRPFIVMEYFAGRSFNSLLRTIEGGKAIRKRSREIFTQMAEIVSYIHQNKVVHRDIKPDNFMLDLENNQLRLIDFSVAERVQGTLRSFFSFGSRDIVGTPTYMSPEHIQKKNPTPAMDIYSFGVMLFEFFAARPPFTGATQNAVLNHILQTPPPPLSRFNPDVSSELEQLINRMLSKNPELRPASMGHFINAFNRIKLYHG